MQTKSFAIALFATLANTAFAEEAAPAGPHSLTGNISLISDYRFRGIDQTFGKPALQGGFDYSHASGLYVGNWNSNVSSGAGYPGGNLEMDFYSGYKGSHGDFGFDVGILYYAYPGTDVALAGGFVNPKTGKIKESGKVDNTEFYVAGSWKTLSLKYSYALGDYFSTPDTQGSGYLDLSGSYDLGGGWGLIGHVGHLYLKSYRTAAGRSGSYTDWKLGVTKDISGWVLGAAYVGTNAKGDCSQGDAFCYGNTDNIANASKTKDGGRDTLLLSVSRTF